MFCTKRSHFTTWPACTWCFAQSDLILPHHQQVQVDVRATGCFTLRYAVSRDERIISQTCLKQHVDVLYNLCLLVYWMQLAILLTSSKLDNMSWFSHRRSPSPPGGHAMVSSVAACCIWPNYGARPTMHCQWGWLRGFSFFCPWRPWPLTLTLKLGRDFCTVYLTAKFDRPTFSRSEVIVRTNKQTNKQTPLKTCTSLRYAMLVGNAQLWLTISMEQVQTECMVIEKV